MVSGGAAGLRAAAAVIAVLAVLVMSTQGHPTEKPLCRDCPSLCGANCTAVADAACYGICHPAVDQCQTCKSGVLKACCPDFCSSSNDTSTVSSCCPSDCISGRCATCSCDYCSAAVGNTCSLPCSSSVPPSVMQICDDCRSEADKQCTPSCISACNENCVKKDVLKKP